MTHDKSTAALRKAEQYQQENLAIARQILATDEQGLRREWARLVIERHAPEELPVSESVDYEWN